MVAIVRNGIALVGVVALFLVFISYAFPAPCKKAFAYSIGTVDKGFRLSEEEFLRVIQKAEAGWEEASGKDLFVYDPSASFTINLIYDERQEKTNQEKAIKDSLATTSKTREGIQQQYESVHREYEKAQDTYDARVASFEADVRSLNEDIQTANNAGGASPGEYKKLQDRQKKLEARRVALEQERQALNTLAARVNTLAGTEEKIVKTYNATVSQLNEEFGEGREFGQGEYTGDAITIYEFSTLQDLRIVLQHELGHALGIGHVQNPASIMYYLAHEKNLNLGGPTSDDLAALFAQCEKSSFDIFLEQLRGAYTQLALSYQ